MGDKESKVTKIYLISSEFIGRRGGEVNICKYLQYLDTKSNAIKHNIQFYQLLFQYACKNLPRGRYNSLHYISQIN